MTNATPNRLGVLDGATPANWADENALFMDKFSGEVLTAFNETNVMKDLHMVRTINEGKSASFPAMGKTSSGYHVPGTPLLGDHSVNHNEKIIKIDDLLQSNIFLANIDEAKNHYDVRREYSKQMGAALARAFDKKTMQVAALGARASALVAGENGGARVEHADNATVASTLASSIFTVAQTFDEKDVPENERAVIIKPAQYYLLAQETSVLNKDWGGSGSYRDGNVLAIAGVQLVKSNNVPTGVIAAVNGENNTYDGNFSTTVGVALHRSALGTVKLMDLATEMTSNDFNVMYQGTLLVAKYAMGHDYLRPDALVEIATGVVI